MTVRTATDGSQLSTGVEIRLPYEKTEAPWQPGGFNAPQRPSRPVPVSANPPMRGPNVDWAAARRRWGRPARGFRQWGNGNPQADQLYAQMLARRQKKYYAAPPSADSGGIDRPITQYADQYELRAPRPTQNPDAPLPSYQWNPAVSGADYSAQLKNPTVIPAQPQPAPRV